MYGQENHYSRKEIWKNGETEGKSWLDGRKAKKKGGNHLHTSHLVVKRHKERYMTPRCTYFWLDERDLKRMAGK